MTIQPHNLHPSLISLFRHNGNFEFAQKLFCVHPGRRGDEQEMEAVGGTKSPTVFQLPSGRRCF